METGQSGTSSRSYGNRSAWGVSSLSYGNRSEWDVITVLRKQIRVGRHHSLTETDQHGTYHHCLTETGQRGTYHHCLTETDESGIFLLSYRNRIKWDIFIALKKPVKMGYIYCLGETSKRDIFTGKKEEEKRKKKEEKNSSQCGTLSLSYRNRSVK